MPPRPALLSIVAHTTTKPPSTVDGALAGGAEDLRAVQHPLLRSLRPQSAVVSIAAESEPAFGSVIAIAPQIGWPPSARNADSGTAALFLRARGATAEPPRAGVGMRR